MSCQYSKEMIHTRNPWAVVASTVAVAAVEVGEVVADASILRPVAAAAVVEVAVAVVAIVAAAASTAILVVAVDIGPEE
jgi:hypothetical protein